MLALVALATAVPCWGQNPSASDVKPMTTKQRLFSIPFFLNPNTQQPAEIHLFVSGDRGDNWFHYQSRRSDQQKFDFQAGEDGIYWFVVRTDREINKPSKSTRPEKIVIVDQVQPDLELSLQIGPTGELIATWQAQDSTLDQQTFRLAYRSSVSQPWQPVVVPNKPNATGETKINGRQSWSVSRDAAEIEVKAEISDQAGNARQVTRRVSLLRPTSNPSATAGSTLPRRDDGASPADGPTPWTTASVSSNSEFEGGWQSRGFAANRSPATDTGNALPPATVDATAAANRDSAAEPTRPAPPPTKQSYEPPIAGQPNTAVPANRTMTRVGRFNLDYEMTGVSGFGADRVELWVTEDGGDVWRPFGVDRDRTSPFEVQTEREGVYGFRLLIHDSAGNSARPPQPGEKPDLTVVVDMTQPKVQLTSATYSPDRPNSVVIRWQATDSYLKIRPVRISFAPLPDGPWSIIESDVPNNGQYEWAPEHRLPGKIYIRVEVTDEAGNVGMAQSQQAVGTSPGGPRAIIRQVRPIP